MKQTDRNHEYGAAIAVLRHAITTLDKQFKRIERASKKDPDDFLLYRLKEDLDGAIGAIDLSIGELTNGRKYKI